jgi:hypothetical protein
MCVFALFISVLFIYSFDKCNTMNTYMLRAMCPETQALHVMFMHVILLNLMFLAMCVNLAVPNGHKKLIQSPTSTRDKRALHGVVQFCNQ